MNEGGSQEARAAATWHDVNTVGPGLAYAYFLPITAMSSGITSKNRVCHQ